ncbi:carbohydrate ABC transporter substrate-binding protein, CUT1 family (TC 3.A.1.1.-) [Promicromonospora umidemergens]|uniref:Carbohydrate ABC transporter substrate-binding protein (CUT1 family) n=1 Tax=Promicromonospora umidemergens TaxID=629679 RepID=A0ABP8WER9_9MICO|nr:sugar ABC transporter substrate-binding protein [Promicromonospora umidemergens]MCP2285919.1 carbohydrate ABC transporter substrate-binding protein, CUT1 family (TC 3.A.1.1.-) [Promicromonospora umidemergens]
MTLPISPRRAGELSRRSFGVLAAASVLAACSRGPQTADPGAPLRVLAINHVWTQAIGRYLPEFEERIGRRVVMRMLTADQLTSSFNVKLNASATDIDVMTIRPLQDQLMFARNGWIADLTDRVEGDTGFRWTDFQEAPRERSTVGGAAVSVPVVTERPALYYRKDLLEDFGGAPQTLDDMLDVALELERRDEGFFGYVGRGQRNGAVSQWSSFLYSFGGDFTHDGRSGIGTPEAIAAYQYYGRLLHEAGPPGVTNMSLEQAMPIFAQGKAAMYIDADAIYSNFLDEKISTVTDTVGFAPFPAGPAGSVPHNIPSWSLAINEFSLLRDDSWEFLRWASSPQMVARLQSEGIPGARQSVWDDPETLASFPAELAETMRVNAANGIGHDRPDVMQVGRARDIVGRPLVSGILGEDVPAVAADADAEFNDFLVRDNRQREF